MLGILGDRSGKNLDRYFPIQLLIVGAVNLSHSPSAERFDDLVWAELSSACQHAP